MKQFIKDCWETIKRIQEIKAKAVSSGQHWY